jgi:hypothetical protein
VPALVPSLGLMLRFWSASLTTRRRSATGSKSIPKLVPLSVNAPGDPTGVAAPVAGSIV